MCKVMCNGVIVFYRDIRGDFNGRGRTSLSLQGFKFLPSCSSVARCSDYKNSLCFSDVGKFIRIIKNHQIV